MGKNEITELCRLVNGESLIQIIRYGYPVVNIQKAIENGDL
jgi:hypothetical protein